MYLYLPSISHGVRDAKSLAWQDKYVYGQCLIDVVNSFCRLLLRVNQALQNPVDFAFTCGRSTYPRSLLRQRNLELLAIALLNTQNTQPGLYQAWNQFQRVRYNCPASVD